MDNCDTAEYRAFRSCFDRLVNGVKDDVESVARKAFTKNLISQENKRSATNRALDATHRADNLLQQVLGKIKQNPAYFNTFVTTLEEILCLKELTKELTTERTKQARFNLCQPGKPAASDATQDSITIEWKKPEYDNDSVMLYFVTFQDRQNSDNPKWEYKLTHSNDTRWKISGLLPRTKYIFKVRPELEDGSTGCWSEFSEPIETKSPPYKCQPGKPMPITVSHDSITLQWKKPDYNCENVESYLVKYRYANGPSKQWIKKLTEGSADSRITVSDLTLQTKYIFMVRPELKDGVGVTSVGIWSEVSDPIETKAPPCQPGMPIACVVTHDSITVEWNKPEHRSETVESYRVRYYIDDQTKAWTNVMTNHNKTKFTASNLSSQTKYIFKVRPELEDGNIGTESEPSDPIQTRASSPPGKPTASDVSYDRIKLSWSPPEYGAENGTNYFVLQCKKNMPGTENWKELKTSSMSTSVEIKGLDPATEYYFKVKLVSKISESSESKPSDLIKTKSMCKPGKPRATKITHNSIVLTWDIPEEYSTTVETYAIVPLSKTHAPTESPLTIKAKPHPHKTESTTISNLSPGAPYTFKVVPSGSKDHRAIAESEPSDLIVTKVTSQPVKPEIVGITNDTATVEWNPPYYGKEHILQYTVCYRSATSSSSDWNEQNTSGNQTRQVITGLSMKTKYMFKVVPKCKHETIGTESEASDSVETCATSPPGVPVPTKVTHNTISLKWTPPEIGKGNVSSYIVYYRQLELKYWKRKSTTIDDGTCISIGDLEEGIPYQFKVKAVCHPDLGIGAESKACDFVSTRNSCTTGKPRARVVAHNSIELEWDKPRHEYDHISCYEVQYRVQEPICSWREERTAKREEAITLSNLQCNTEYIFRVKPICSDRTIFTQYSRNKLIKTKDKPDSDQHWLKKFFS